MPSSSRYSALISATQLHALQDSPSLLILDCRSDLNDHAWGRQAFEAGHIPGALFADLETELAAPPSEAGRHPLPDRGHWAQSVAEWGVGDDTQVVVYDHAGGAFAARAWWMFNWLGHASVAVLDGGIGHWQGALESGTGRTPQPAAFTVRDPLVACLDSAEMLAKVNDTDNTAAIVDARTRPRWAGAQEPIDPVAGHIPGAVCLPFQDNLQDDGRFKPAAQLRARFAALEGLSEVICYCGSGVTAAHNILAMTLAGLPPPILYAPSWSGWITDPTRPVASADL